MFSGQYVPGRSLRNEQTVHDIFESEVQGLHSTHIHGYLATVCLSKHFKDKHFICVSNERQSKCMKGPNRLIVPRSNPASPFCFGIMWSSTRNDTQDMDWIPNHFVPLWGKENESFKLLLHEDPAEWSSQAQPELSQDTSPPRTESSTDPAEPSGLAQPELSQDT